MPWIALAPISNGAAVRVPTASVSAVDLAVMTRASLGHSRDASGFHTRNGRDCDSTHLGVAQQDRRSRQLTAVATKRLPKSGAKPLLRAKSPARIRLLTR